jgi:hypothetical protein
MISQGLRSSRDRLVQVRSAFPVAVRLQCPRKSCRVSKPPGTYIRESEALHVVSVTADTDHSAVVDQRIALHPEPENDYSQRLPNSFLSRF